MLHGRVSYLIPVVISIPSMQSVLRASIDSALDLRKCHADERMVNIFVVRGKLERFADRALEVMVLWS